MSTWRRPSACSVTGCPKNTHAKALCQAHYRLALAYGKPETLPRPTPDDRFWAKVNKTEDCWLWTGSASKFGHGQFFLDGRLTQAHRYLFEKQHGPVPEGLELDHLCRTPACVRPDHLEAVTHLENMRRGLYATKTHCINGHEFTPENTYVVGGSARQRQCRECGRIRSRRYSAARRAS